MKPAPLDYAAPETLAEAVALLADASREAKVIAGGQSLMPMLNMRLARPELLVDLRRVDGLDHIREEHGAIRIGAMTSKREVEQSPLVRERLPLLHAATLHVGHPQIRSRGTVGGSMAQADPAAEYPCVAVALGATMRVVGPGGERTIPAADFFVTYLTTALEEDEILVEVSFPVPAPGTGWSFTEISRRHGDFALAGAAITVALDGAGTVADSAIVLFGVGPGPVRAHAAEARIRGGRPGDELYREAGAAVAAALTDPPADVHADSEYRRHLAVTMTTRGLAEAVQRT